MPKRRSPALDYAVYLAVRFVVCLVQALTWNAALALARGLAWLAHRVDRRHREVAAENLRHAYPGLGDADLGRLVCETYRHFVTVVVEMIRMPRVLNPKNLADYLVYADPTDYDRIVYWINQGRPIVGVTGHFGNWEMVSYSFGLWGIRGAAVARRLDNPYLHRFLDRFRHKTGMRILDKNADYDQILATLAGRGILGLVGDQDAGPRGLFVDFMNRPASTFKSIALLSLEYAAPVIVLGAARVGTPMRYHIYVEDVIVPEEYAGERDAAQMITQRYTAALERMVRRHPEQYFWLHRRWKHAPPVRKAKASVAA